MFDWFWEFLYGITKSLLRLIDGLVSCTNKLCGIESVNIDGKETDLVSYLLRSEGLANGFKIAAIIGFIVLVFFTIFRIIMVVVKEKPDMSPGQVAVKAFKTLLLFFFVPAIMLTLVWALNTIMGALYQATMGESQSLGTFLFRAFSQDSEILNQPIYDQIIGSVDLYKDTDLVEQAIELSDFDFIFSWITGCVLLFTLANALIQFVDRAISIAVLFFVSPFSIASAVLDDGARFKLWREQVLIKFISGYGIIIYLNIYCLLVSLITPNTVVFFESNFLNNLFKLLIILGGGVAMQRAAALIGNLLSQGAGSRELMDSSLGRWGAAAATGGLKLLGKGAKAGLGKLFGKKADGKGDESKKEAAEGAGSANDTNEGEKFDKEPKGANSENLAEKMRNGSGEGKKDATPGGDGTPKTPEGGGSGDNKSGDKFSDDKNEVNKSRGDEIKSSLANIEPAGSINDDDDDDDSEDMK